ncbi:MAG: hypothetical protein ACLFPF_04145 [Halanaerobiales bacterium]
MFKWLLRFLLTVLLIIGIGGMGYLYVMSEDVSSPEIPVIEIPSQPDEESLLNRNEEQRHLLAQKRIAMDHQARLLENKKRLLGQRKDEIEEYINSESEKIRNRYQSRINAFQEKLDIQLSEFIEEKEEEYNEQMLAKQELYNTKLNLIVSSMEEDSLTELEQYRQNLLQNYYAQKVNYDLKLKFLDLSNEEKQEYLNNLAELETEYQLLIEDKSSTVNQEFESQIEEHQKRYNNELSEFESSLKSEIEREITQKELELDNELEEYLVNQQALLEEEIEKRSKEIRNRSQGEIDSLESIIREISQEYFSIQSEVSILEKEVMY